MEEQLESGEASDSERAAAAPALARLNAFGRVSTLLLRKMVHRYY
jgi:hypothetical protein